MAPIMLCIVLIALHSVHAVPAKPCDSVRLEVRQQQALPTIGSYMKLYTSLQTSKCAPHVTLLRILRCSSRLHIQNAICKQ